MPITREEEEKMIQEWLEKNEATILPPDERIAQNSGTISPWFRNKNKVKKPTKPKKHLT